MTTIKEMRDAVQALMAKQYDREPALAEATDTQVEGRFFMRKEDAAAVRDCCKHNNLKVSFRVAGLMTLDRIRKGNPCKGHTILDKSIKEKEPKVWTYKAPEATLTKLAGLVGHSEGDSNLTAVWVLEGGANAVLRKVGDLKDTDLQCAFTGDYDMHDLIKGDARILSTTPDEHSTIEAINNALAGTRKAQITSTSTGKRNFESPYALVRHGAQTSFISYLLSGAGGAELKISNTARIPYEDQVTHIDGPIAVFDSIGKAYILASIAEVYWYYRKNGLLDQIPFYYFFKDLRANYPKQIQEHTDTLNGLLSKYVRKQ